MEHVTGWTNTELFRLFTALDRRARRLELTDDPECEAIREAATRVKDLITERVHR